MYWADTCFAKNFCININYCYNTTNIIIIARSILFILLGNSVTTHPLHKDSGRASLNRTSNWAQEDRMLLSHVKGDTPRAIMPKTPIDNLYELLKRIQLFSELSKDKQITMYEKDSKERIRSVTARLVNEIKRGRTPLRDPTLNSKISQQLGEKSLRDATPNEISEVLDTLYPGFLKETGYEPHYRPSSRKRESSNKESFLSKKKKIEEQHPAECLKITIPLEEITHEEIVKLLPDCNYIKTSEYNTYWQCLQCCVQLLKAIVTRSKVQKTTAQNPENLRIIFKENGKIDQVTPSFTEETDMKLSPFFDVNNKAFEACHTDQLENFISNAVNSKMGLLLGMYPSNKNEQTRTGHFMIYYRDENGLAKIYDPQEKKEVSVEEIKAYGFLKTLFIKQLSVKTIKKEGDKAPPIKVEP